MTDITLVLPYYDNPAQLQRQLDAASALRSDVQDRIELIVVDDGSPDHPLTADRCALVAPWLRASFWRIGADVRWNWMSARNIGAHEARGTWLLLTDIDHMPPEDTLAALLAMMDAGELHTRRCYDFARQDMPGRTENPKRHPNSWLMTKKHYWQRVGGYDERWAGTYGSDSHFRRRCEAASRRPGVGHLDLPLLRFPGERYPDAVTRRYERKTAEDARRKVKVRAMIARSPQPVTLSYDYRLVHRQGHGA